MTLTTRFLALLCFFSGLTLAAEQDSRPNILFIMVDDMGYADVGAFGGRHNDTPNLDQLASEGMRLTNGYANSSICSPSRTGLATGQYQYRFPVGLEEPIGPMVKDPGLPEGTPTWGSLLQEQGYNTSLIGKWHLGDPPNHGPLQHGWEHFFGISKGAADYFRHKVNLSKPGEKTKDKFAKLTGNDPYDSLTLNNTPVEREGYLTDLFADEAIKLIKARDDRPFAISLHFNAPHWPWEGPEDQAISAALNNIFHTDGGSLETYSAMMKSMDSNVGRILDTLKKEGLSDNTIVIFTSDNGAERYSDTWPFSGMKGELLEGGIRVPIIVRWPGHVASGSTSEQVMISMDFIPTLLAAAQADVNDAQFDGRNLLPVLTGKQAPVERTLFWRYKSHDQHAVREGDWKYLKIGDYEHLYNVAKDPRERAELADKYPEKFAELKAKFAAWNESMLPYPEKSFSQDNIGKHGDRY